MQFDKKAYQNRVNARKSARSPLVRNCLRAFLVGALVCGAAQGLIFLYEWAGLSPQNASFLATVSVIFLTALFSALGLFDALARFAGAGTLVPVSGFANAVTSAALDAKSEGLVMGVGAKIFSVAGPVILYGTLSGTLYGVVYFVLRAVGVL